MQEKDFIFLSWQLSLLSLCSRKEISKMVLDRWVWFSRRAFKLDCNVKNSCSIFKKSVLQNLAGFQDPFVFIHLIHLRYKWIAFENVAVGTRYHKTTICLGREELYIWLQRLAMYYANRNMVQKNRCRCCWTPTHQEKHLYVVDFVFCLIW